MFRNLLIISFFCCLGLLVHAEEKQASEVSLIKEEEFKVICIQDKSKEVRSQETVQLRNVSRKDPKQYQIVSKGEGDFNQFKDAYWVSKSDIQFENDAFKTLSSESIFRDNENKILIKYKKEYDYINEVIRFQEIDSNGSIKSEKIFPIKGPTCDDITMVHFLRTLVLAPQDDGARKFYLVTNEPKYYKVNMKERAREVLKLPFGDVKAIKYQLMADLGPLTEVAAKFFPSTYVWYEEDFPHSWLQYRGMEAGLNTPYVTIYRVNDKLNRIKVQ